MVGEGKRGTDGQRGQQDQCAELGFYSEGERNAPMGLSRGSHFSMVPQAAVEIDLGLTTVDKTTLGQCCGRAALLTLGPSRAPTYQSSGRNSLKPRSPLPHSNATRDLF